MGLAMLNPSAKLPANRMPVDMQRIRTLKIMVLLLAGYFPLWLPALFSSAYLDSPLGIVAALPFLSVYLFNLAGVPGLLEHNGACGWGWCAPTMFGWTFIVAFWLFVFWLAARLIESLTSQPGETPDDTH
jgi:hypothetical protein